MTKKQTTKWWEKGAVKEFRDQFPKLTTPVEHLEMTEKIGGTTASGLEIFIHNMEAKAKKKERQLVIEELEELIKAEMIDFTCYQTMAGTQNLKDLAHNAALEELLSKLQTPKQS